MNIEDYLWYYVFWGSIGTLFFNVFVILVFRTGIVWKTRNKEDYSIKKDISPVYIPFMAVVPLSIISLHLISNYISIILPDIQIDFIGLFIVNYVLYLLLFLYDTFVIDLFVLGMWRPSFLMLPNTSEGEGSVKKHLLLSLPVGITLGALITLISTLVSYALFF